MTTSAPARIRISLNQQIEEIEHHLKQAKRASGASADARMHVLRLEATLETLKLVRRFENDVRAVIRHGLEREREISGGKAGDAA